MAFVDEKIKWSNISRKTYSKYMLSKLIIIFIQFKIIQCKYLKLTAPLILKCVFMYFLFDLDSYLENNKHSLLYCTCNCTYNSNSCLNPVGFNKLNWVILKINISFGFVFKLKKTKIFIRIGGFVHIRSI